MSVLNILIPTIRYKRPVIRSKICPTIVPVKLPATSISAPTGTDFVYVTTVLSFAFAIEPNAKFPPVCENVALFGMILDGITVIFAILAFLKNVLSFPDFDKSKLEGTYVRYPERSELSAEINEALIVEYYSR